MDFNSSFWWFGLHGCLFCGSLFPRPEGLCQICATELWRWSQAEELFWQELEGLEAAALFQWIPGRQEVLSHLILALKGPGAGRLWREFAHIFWRKYQVSTEVIYKQIVLVPSPSRAGKDHALLFTEGLAQASGARVLHCLARPKSTTKQKTKNRSARSRATFDWAENFSADRFAEETQNARLIFVDDVVTTGATARAAWIRLGRPDDFMICSLAQRSLSCGASTNLV